MSSGRITLDQLEAIAAGASLLGSGGGGDPYVGRLLAEEAIRRHGPVELVSIDELSDGAAVFPVAMMGAPTVMVEKLPATSQLSAAVHALSRYMDRDVEYIACAEVGGVNSMIPIATAAELGVPLIDGDGMGRAFPELQMILPTLIGAGATPMSIADEKGNKGIFETITNKWAELLARDVTVEMGSSAIVSLYPLTGAQTKAGFVSGSLSLCARLGSAGEYARTEHRDPVDAIIATLGGVRLFDGKVADVERRTQTGFARGTASIVPEGARRKHLRILFQNENLLAEIDGRTLAATPDLIIVIDADTGAAVTTEGLRYGQRVAVIAAPADPRWYTPAGLELVGPAYFGYDAQPVFGAESR